MTRKLNHDDVVAMQRRICDRDNAEIERIKRRNVDDLAALRDLCRHEHESTPASHHRRGVVHCPTCGNWREGTVERSTWQLTQWMEDNALLEATRSHYARLARPIAIPKPDPSTVPIPWIVETIDQVRGLR